MINYKDGEDIKSIIANERKTIQNFKVYESNIKLTLETYTKEFDNITFENEVLKVMLLNSFDNAIMQVDGIIQDIESLSNVLDILQNQNTISSSDIETYNKLFSKVKKDIILIQNFIQKSMKSFENVSYTGSSKSLLVLDKCKDVFSLNIPGDFDETNSDSKENKLPEKKIESSILIKKDFDFNSSDLLCFFPKSKSENLVISTMQDNYKISFKQNQATIYIKEENFNISLNTSGVQVSNSKTNNILFVSHSSNKYIIITNNQIEIPNFIQVSKISKNEDFLEVEFAANNLFLSIKENIIFFEQETSQKNTIQEEENNKVLNPSLDKEIASNNKTAKHFKEEVPIKVSEDTESVSKIQPPTDDDEIVDNNTLIISDSSQKVILPYTIEDLKEKMKKNKKYKSLQEVIKNEYTLPLETFKNPIKSRFKEAFQLIKKKEHGSLKEAIGLGFELMFQSDLNPAVIAACKDLDELDIYLDCLDDNELDKFSCFKIEYNVKPTKGTTKNSKK